MYGTIARIGLLIPSVNTIIEEEFNALKPDGFSVHATRMVGGNPTIKSLEKMAEDTEAGAEMIAALRPSIVAFGCTTGSLLHGVGWDEGIIKRIKKIVKVPVTTTATAVIRAFKAFEISKIVVGTPYNKELNRLETEFFEHSGIEVLALKGLDLSVEQMHQLPLEKVTALAREVNKAKAEAIFLSCTNLKTIPIVARLEKELRKPVLSSNLATFWDIMSMLDFNKSIKGFGKLLEGIQGNIHN